MNFDNNFLSCIVIVLVKSSVCDRASFWGVEQNWGYITVRPHAHIFYWLFYTTAAVSNYTERPLMIWLQGGPGAASSGFGVFAELGPVDLNENVREHTWVKDFNLLSLDSPIDTGFSYFSKDTAEAASNNTFIAEDLVKFFELFLSENPEFQNIPTYIFGESYGGKMAVDFAYQLHLKIREGEIKCDLKGIGLGDAFISPSDYFSLFGDIAYHLGLLDDNSRKIIDNDTRDIKTSTDRGYYTISTLEMGILTIHYANLMGNIDLYNLNAKTTPSSHHSMRQTERALGMFMNEKIKPLLGIPENLTWSFTKANVMTHLLDDFLRPVTDTIERLLNSTDIKIVVYNGMLDLIVNTLGTSNWLKNLKWARSVDWSEAPNIPFVVNGTIEGLLKRVGNLALYSVHRAGHTVPADNPAAMSFILEALEKPLKETKIIRRWPSFTYDYIFYEIDV